MNFNTPKALVLSLIISIPASYYASDTIPGVLGECVAQYLYEHSPSEVIVTTEHTGWQHRKILLEDNVFVVNTSHISNFPESNDGLVNISFDVETSEPVSFYVVEIQCKEGEWSPVVSFKSEDMKEKHQGKFRYDSSLQHLRFVAYQVK